MIITEKPYFMTNTDWYYYDEDEFEYKVTDKAPQEAVDSYNEFHDKLDSQYVVK